MSVRAYDAVCWYEKLKQFPKTDSSGFLRECFGRAENVRKQIPGNDDMAKRYFGDWMFQLAITGLPQEYTTCVAYLKDPAKKFATDHSETLNIASSGGYPYKGFANCMLTQLSKRHGTKAIEAVKNEKTHKKKHWIATILERDNEFRARHGVPSFQLAKELNTEAQKWADKLARECRMYHSSSQDPGRTVQGSKTGESLSAGGGNVTTKDAAYISANGWYEEIKDYPYPKGYTGRGGGILPKVGHFTQTVWKNTKYVGYGHAYNFQCSGMKWFFVARYSTQGNVIGAFAKNVLPPKK